MLDEAPTREGSARWPPRTLTPRPETMTLPRSLLLASFVLSLGVAALACSGDEDAGAAGAGSESEEEELHHGLTKAQAAELLAKVGDREITVGEFAERLADQSPYLRARYNTPERRREFLDNLIRFELLAQEAERRGLDELPEVQRTRKQVMIQQMMRERFEDRIQLSDVTDEEIRAYYEAHLDEFNKPEQVRASPGSSPGPRCSDRRAPERAPCRRGSPRPVGGRAGLSRGS